MSDALNEIKVQAYAWYEYQSSNPLIMGTTQGNSFNLSYGDKFGLKMSHQKKINVVSYYNLDKIFVISPAISEKLSNVSIPTVYKNDIVLEELHEQEYYEMSAKDKKIFTKLVTDFVKLNDAQEKIDWSTVSNKSYKNYHGNSAENKLDDKMKKMEDKKDVLNNKFKETFKSYIPKEKFKDFSIHAIASFEEDLEEIDYLIQDFLKKPIVQMKKSKKS